MREPAAAAQDELALENLAAAARAARQAGAVVLLEPLSGLPQYPLRTADDVLGVLDRLPSRLRRRRPAAR